MDRSLAADPVEDSAAGRTQDREPRTSRLFVGQLALEEGIVVKIRIRNLSEGGFGGRSDIVLRPGQRGHMLLAGVGLITGRIAWANQFDFGLQFDEKIDPALARLSSPAPSPQAEYVVPAQFRPVADHRRPGLKVR